MADKESDVKKNLVDALKSLGVDLDDTTKQKRSSPEEEYEDYSEMSHKTRQKIDELNEKSETILEKMGMSREDLEAYGTNQNNFTKEQWEALQKIKAITEDYKKMALDGIKESMSQDILEAEKKEIKKQHTRFAKKKDWKPV